MNKFVLLIVLLAPGYMLSQTGNEHDFDFWIGSWDAYWKDSLRGSNKINRILNDRVVEENFIFNDRTFTGRSWTVYDTSARTWRQTWVDDAGVYLLFSGGKQGEELILKMTEKRMVKGKTIYRRMVFLNIKENSFEWLWQNSEDEKNWRTAWHIQYKRNSRQ